MSVLSDYNRRSGSGVAVFNPAWGPREPTRRQVPVPPVNPQGGTFFSQLQAANPRQAPAPIEEEDEGGTFGRGLGYLVNNPVTQTALKPLQIIDVPKRFLLSTINEAVIDPLTGDDASFGDWWDQISRADFGTGEIVGDLVNTGNETFDKWANRAIGLTGDIAFDPLTYLTAGVAPVAGKAYRATKLADLLSEQRRAAQAVQRSDAFKALGFGDEAVSKALGQTHGELLQKTAQLGGDEALERLGRRGLGVANPAQLEAMNLPGQGLRLRNPLTGTEWTRPIMPKTGEKINQATGWAREGIKKIPGTESVRKVRNPKGFLDQPLGPAFERILTGKGGGKISDAIEEVAFDNMLREAGGTFQALSVRRLDQLAKELDGMGESDFVRLRAEAAAGTENALTEYAKEVRRIAASPLIGSSIPEIGGGILYSMPQVMSRKFRNRLRKAIEANDVTAKEFMDQAGIRTRDLLEESGFRQKRSFVPGESIKIGDETIEIVDGTIDELNEKFGALFPDFEGKIYETNPLQAYRQYLRGTTRDVARTAAGRRAARAGFENIQRAGEAPKTYSGVGKVQGPGDLPDQAVRIPGEFQENKFYRGAADKKLTDKRNRELRRVQEKFVKAYATANRGQRYTLAEEVRTNIRNVVTGAREVRDRLRRQINQLQSGVGVESDAVSRMRAELDDVEDRIKALDAYRQQIAETIGPDADPIYREVLGEAAEQRDQLIRDIASFEDQYNKLVNDLAVPARERSQRAAAEAARQEEDLNLALPIDDVARRADETAAALSELPSTTLSTEDTARLSQAKTVLASDEYREYLQLSQRRRELLQQPPVLRFTDQERELREVRSAASRAQTEATLASSKGRQQSMLRKAKDLRRRAQEIDAELLAGKDNLENIEQNITRHRNSVGGFRSRKAQADRQRYHDLLDKREAMRARRNRYLDEARGIEDGATRVRDRKALPELRKKSEEATARLRKAEGDLHRARRDAMQEYRNQLKQIDDRLDQITPPIRTAQDDLFKLTGRGRSAAETEVIREATEASDELRRVQQARAERRAPASSDELRRLEDEARLAVEALNNQAHEAELQFFGRNKKVPRSSVEYYTKYIRDNPGKVRGFDKVTSKRRDLADQWERASWGSDRKKELARQINELDSRIAKDFEELITGRDVIARWNDQQRRLRRTVNSDLRTAAENAVRRYKEALARMGDGGPTQQAQIKALQEQAGEFDRVMAQIDQFVGEPLEELRGQLREIEAPARQQAIEAKASSAVLDERAAEEQVVQQMKKQAIEDRLAEQIVRDQFDRLEDIGRARQQLDAVESALNEGSKATSVAGRKVSARTPTTESQMREAIEDARKIARQNPDLNDETLNEIERLLSENVAQLDELAQVNMTDKAARELLADIKAGRLGPVITARLRQEWKHLIPDDDIVISQRMAGMFRQIDTAVNKQPALFGRVLTAFTNFFKTYAVMTPGFHVRNAMSAVFMNIVDGVRLGTQREGLQLWREWLKADDPLRWLEGQSKEIQDAFKATFASGAGGRFLESGVAEAGEGAGRFREWLYSNKATITSQKAGGYIEGGVRMGMALDSVRRGYSVPESLERISRIHFDYSQVSEFDENAKKLIPFWTFMSRNLPTQATLMWTKPRVYNYYQSVIENISDEPDPNTPMYWLRQGAFNIGGDYYLDPDLPHTRVLEDFERFAKLGEGDFNPMLSNFNPFFTAPIEYFTGQNLFTGYTVPEDAVREVGILDYPAAALGSVLDKTHRREDGSWVVNERIASALQSLIPDLDRAHRLAPGLSGEDFRTGTTLEGWLRWGGAPYRKLTDDRRASEARRRGREQMDEMAMQRMLAGG